MLFNGSSSFITDAAGLAEQHIQYLPFGELFVSQRNTSFDSRYKFTAKELDNETNYTYFGARYYDSDLSIWLSVDPLADKAPGWSPYRYGFQNPIRFIDPNGMFESKQDAKDHKKNKNLDGRVKLIGKDQWGIIDKKNHVVYFQVKNPDELETMFGADENGIMKTSAVFGNDKRQRFGGLVYGDQPDFSKSPFKNYRSRNQDESWDMKYQYDPLMMIAEYLVNKFFPGQWPFLARDEHNGVSGDPRKNRPELRPSEEDSLKFPALNGYNWDTIGEVYMNRKTFKYGPVHYYDKPKKTIK
jgi:RHS repeat-associated protein